MTSSGPIAAMCLRRPSAASKGEPMAFTPDQVRQIATHLLGAPNTRLSRDDDLRFGLERLGLGETLERTVLRP